MKNLKDFMVSKKNAILVGLSSMALMTNVFAEDPSGSTATAVTAALKTTATNITSSLNAIAPIGLGIAGTFLVWRYGMRFFKSLSK